MMTNFDIIFLVVVVVFVFQKLRSVLGTRPDEIPAGSEKAAHIVNVIMKETQAAAEQPEEELSETDKTLRQIPNFNKEKFLNSAKKAFEIIVEAFAKGDTEMLEMLINPKLFKRFQEVIEGRRKEGVQAETDFIGFDEAEITQAKISKTGTAKISVRFVSEQVNLLRDKDGAVIQGDENFIQKITDVWTFERALTSTSPNWLVTSTKKS